MQRWSWKEGDEKKEKKENSATLHYIFKKIFE
jgi:hypothetical protein